VRKDRDVTASSKNVSLRVSIRLNLLVLGEGVIGLILVGGPLCGETETAQQVVKL
jgi:hypothetical protein